MKNNVLGKKLQEALKPAAETAEGLGNQLGLVAVSCRERGEFLVALAKVAEKAAKAQTQAEATIAKARELAYGVAAMLAKCPKAETMGADFQGMIGQIGSLLASILLQKEELKAEPKPAEPEIDPSLLPLVQKLDAVRNGGDNQAFNELVERIEVAHQLTVEGTATIQ